MFRAALAAIAMACASPAFGAAYEVTARTEAQAYQIRSYRDSDPNNPVLIPRRRLVQYLGLDVYELVTGQPFGFESSMRVFADLGMPLGEAAKVDGLKAEGAELLYANVHYDGPSFSFRVGRQLYVDFMDYMAFDGAKLGYTTAGGYGGEAYAGLWVKGASLLASNVYQPDGTRDTDVRRLALAIPGASAVADDIEPVYGVKALAKNVAGTGLSATLGYRKALVTGKTDLERLSLEARHRTRLGKLGNSYWVNTIAGAEYDLFMSRLSNARLQLRVDNPLWALSAEAMHVTPVLSSDSIFLYFATAPRDELRARFDFTPVGPLRYYVDALSDSYGLSLNTTNSVVGSVDAKLIPSGSSTGFGGGILFRSESLHAVADVTYRAGYGGSQTWFDLTAGWAPRDDPYTFDARFSYANIADQQNPLLKGAFTGVQLWGSYRLAPTVRLSLVLEENVNPYTRSDTKMFFLFDFKTALQ